MLRLTVRVYCGRNDMLRAMCRKSRQVFHPLNDAPKSKSHSQSAAFFSIKRNELNILKQKKSNPRVYSSSQPVMPFEALHLCFYSLITIHYSLN